MYQCTWFYTSNLVFPKNKDVVAAAWSVTADEFYRYEMSEDDSLSLKDMYCFIRTVEGEGRLETVDGEKIFLPKNSYIIVKRKKLKEYRSTHKIWKYFWVDFLCYSPLKVKTDKIYTTDVSEHEYELFNELLDVGREFPNEIDYINSVFRHYFFNLTLKYVEKPASAAHSVKLSEVCTYIQQKLYSRITVTEIANFFNVSSRRIHQIFNDSLHVISQTVYLRPKNRKGKADT